MYDIECPLFWFGMIHICDTLLFAGNIIAIVLRYSIINQLENLDFIINID